ncbi:NAD(P)-dependent dehydrogenase (short-subunit alcohol dehydrogenase family)/pimeloyl-ACP methyl ester carboxylesterase [Saccharomonospora amisosensis]|uniref:NAD(P)-dependent dehydrogenase (Short-subunit alcohol dehydrogenase family)/pimeloyl-ACP methyl ester carboxylesterase n=1 Tax=Saccharomonospora amisosensis TaxID=1128677 RepID=A0A7X5ZP24_9PSEU|nr:SDR family oxidoreductase [Saccharomonospora amisosensis]NIJ10343.1 NAD(P)-dependent dehydrogenase (short-subunit alcohol dehydrogenase family)/pimeloyl-ACP methyl ester carboxylesterase [Saccharomonospora amisosensis]
MSRQWVTTSDGVRLSVRVTGPQQAPTIVCVHGYPDNSSLWDGVRAQFGDRFRVVSYDVRGAGESTKPRSRGAYRLDRLAADLAEVIDEVAPEGKVHLLGHDWGAIQTWHAVTGRWLRGRVASFTSVSGPCLDHAGRWFRAQLRPSPRRLRAAIRQLAHSTYIAFFQLPVLPELAWRGGLLARLIRRADPDAAVPELSDGLHGLWLYRENMLSRLTRPGRRHADVPVQVIAPAADAFVTVPLQTQIERWVPDLRVRTIPGGHWVVRGDPGRIATATAEFVEHVHGGPQSRALRRSRVNPAPRGRFEGRLVVVTGAGSGIGNATARAFAAQGADMVLADIDADALGTAAQRVRRAGGQALPYRVDVGDAEEMAEFAAAVRAEHGVADIVVNNAGIGVAGPFLDTGVREWERVIDVNLWGVIHGCRLFGAQLAERGEGGHIVNVASVAAYLPTKVLPAYSATKAAVLMLSECLRAELAAYGIGVSAICPGMVSTNIAGTTTFTGADEREQHARRAEGARLFARRGFPPERVAGDILRAVRRDSAVVASTPEARTALALSRLTPGLLRAAARTLPG